jgi:cysteine desulfurase
MELSSMDNGLHEEYSHTRKIIYLDNNATTREDKSVIESMINHLKCSNSFGNPSSSHLVGIETRYLIDEAREQVRSSINASYSNEIIFTSGGTESNNLAIQGILKSNLNNSQHIITTPFEHPSVANLLKHLQNSNRTIEISFVKVDSNGIIDLQHFHELLKPETKLVTIMHSNNEIGLFTFILIFENIFRNRFNSTNGRDSSIVS